MHSRDLFGLAFCALLVSALTACSGVAHDNAAAMVAPNSTKVVLATPLQVPYQSELALARLGQLLSNSELTNEQRAELFYERGVVFDRVGLRTMARIDFTRALRERPDFAEAYNFLGVYLTAQQAFDEAYDAFDSALELMPDYDYAYLNRGIALYYGDRDKLAVKDLAEFYRRKPEDPYRVLWLYIVEAKLDSKLAMQELQRRYKQHTGDEWGWSIVSVYAGQRDIPSLLAEVEEVSRDNRELAERLCEAYFYFAKLAQLQGDDDRATNYLKLALASNVYDFIEHRYALLELQLQAPQEDDALSVDGGE